MKRANILHYQPEMLGKFKFHLKDILDEYNIPITDFCRHSSINYNIIKKYYDNTMKSLNIDTLLRICYSLNTNLSNILEFQQHYTDVFDPNFISNHYIKDKYTVKDRMELKYIDKNNITNIGDLYCKLKDLIKKSNFLIDEKFIPRNTTLHYTTVSKYYNNILSTININTVLIIIKYLNLKSFYNLFEHKIDIDKDKVLL